MLAVYISATQFRVEDDLTTEFSAGRRIKADCGVDGIKYSTIQTSSYSSPNTTVTITESVLTSNLVDILYGIINVGAEGSFPDHSHDNTEGHGGQLSFTDLINKSLLTLDDTPGAYSNGKFLKSTTNGFVLEDTPDQTTFSGTEVFVDGDATVTGTVYAHVYDSYSPLTIKDGGVNVIVGNGAGKVDFPNGITVSGTPAVGPQGLQGIQGEQGLGWLFGSGAPAVVQGRSNEFYLDTSTYNIYSKDDAIFGSNLVTETSSAFSDVGIPAQAVTVADMWSVNSPTEIPTLYYDFGSDFNEIINRVIIDQGWSVYMFGSGDISFSNDNVDYTVLHTFSGPDVAYQSNTYDFSNVTVYRYMRIRADSSAYTGRGIKQLQAFAYDEVDWQQAGNIKGADGATASGTTGSSWHYGTTDPITEGEVGDYYLKTPDQGIWYRTSESGIVATETVTNESYTIGQENPTYLGGAFDGVINDGNATGAWYAYPAATSGWTGQDFGSGNEQRIGKYRIYSDNATTAAKSWTFEASSTGLWAGEEVVLDTQTNYSFTSSLTWHDFTFDNPNSYRYYRLNVSANNGHETYLVIREIEMWPADVSAWEEIWTPPTASSTTSSGGASTFLELTDTPSSYSEGLFAQSTTSGIVWTAISGVNSSSSSTVGNWLLVDSLEFNDETFSKSFTIDGDTYPRVRVECIITDSPTSVGDFVVTLNNDTGANYGYSYLTQINSSVSAGASTENNFSILLGGYEGAAQSFAIADFYLKSGGYRHARSSINLYRPTNTGQRQVYVGCWWTNTVDNVSSIDISSSTATTGEIKVYRWQDITEAINTTFIGLDDTPATYSGIEGNYLRTTASGLEAVDGIILTASDQSEWVIRVTTSGVLYTEAV